MRSLLRSAVATVIAAGVAAIALPSLAQAQQKFPIKPIRLVVAGSAGSQTDILARMIGPKMSENWGHPVVVENRAGAAGTIGQEERFPPRPALARAAKEITGPG